MLRFISISSGSNGNCYYFGDEESAILVDVGIGFRTVKQRLEACGVDLKKIGAVLVTHDHSDHIRGLGTLAKRLSVPVFATSRLHDALSRTKYAEDCYPGCRRVIKTGMLYDYRGVHFFAMEVPHDATQTLCYGIDYKGVKIFLMTDLGFIPDYAEKFAREADYIIIESNYDVEMLLKGPYPQDLKSRIMGDFGHLENSVSAGFISKIYNDNLKGVFLCHISKENNLPELAYETMRKSIAVPNEGFILQALPRSEVYETLLR